MNTYRQGEIERQDVSLFWDRSKDAIKLPRIYGFTPLALGVRNSTG